jgi:hypothetical protein
VTTEKDGSLCAAFRGKTVRSIASLDRSSRCGELREKNALIEATVDEDKEGMSLRKMDSFVKRLGTCEGCDSMLLVVCDGRARPKPDGGACFWI